jgi:hypothetical protein
MDSCPANLTQAGRLVMSKNVYTEPAVQYTRFVNRYVPNTENIHKLKLTKTKFLTKKLDKTLFKIYYYSKYCDTKYF